MLQKAETAFNIELKNYRKDVSNPKSIPVDQHFRKSWHSFNLHAKFTLIKALSNTHTTNTPLNSDGNVLKTSEL